MNLTLDEMKKLELGILKAVDALCQKEGITYYLAFGTLLGAVRHGGFIPWDDDVDIYMPREDYDRFLTAAKELPGHLTLKYSGNTHPYLYDFAKVEDGRTLLIEDTYSYLGIESAVYIDIFPLDGCPASPLRRKLHMLHIRLWQELLAMHFADPDKPRSFWKRPIVRFVQKHLTQDGIYARIVRNSRKFPVATSPFIGYSEGNMNELMPKTIYGVPSPIAFEDGRFMGPEDPDAYLTHVYGDYRKLPPENERIAHGHSVVRYRD